MILETNPDYRLNLSQGTLFWQERDPRTSDSSDYLEKLRLYVSESIKSLRDGQMRALGTDFAPLNQQLDVLENLRNGWDGFDAPMPTRETINEAREILRRLQRQLVRPQRISASAEGGVAFSFRTSGDRRAQVEILNSGERFAHLYDLLGNSYTHEWPKNYMIEPFGDLLEPILNYMRR